ncbi:MAG: hypothetical protein JWN43_4840 [Gammaproteobacteria bacterium]|nr:hypothetical protein [Gammaproteobacteria bacterium]
MSVDPSHSDNRLMKKQEVDVVVVVAVERDALLALDEGEPGSELKEEAFDLAEERGLKMWMDLLRYDS